MTGLTESRKRGTLIGTGRKPCRHHTAPHPAKDTTIMLPNDTHTPAPADLLASGVTDTDIDPAPVSDPDAPENRLPAETIVALKEQGIDPATWAYPLEDVEDIDSLHDVDITALLLPSPRRKTTRTSIGELLLTEDWNLPFNEFTHKRKVFGMNLPTFQRGLKWSLAQEVAFIESILRDLPTGLLMRTEVYRDPETGELHPLSGFLMDGQQRCTTLQRFLRDEFGVCGVTDEDTGTYYGIRFSQFSRESRALFLSKTLDVVELDPRHYTMAALHEIYNRYNYGGTVHAIAERETLDATLVQNIRLVGNQIVVVDGYGEQTIDVRDLDLVEAIDPDVLDEQDDDEADTSVALALSAIVDEEQGQDDADQQDVDPHEAGVAAAAALDPLADFDAGKDEYPGVWTFGPGKQQ